MHHKKLQHKYIEIQRRAKKTKKTKMSKIDE